MLNDLTLFGERDKVKIAVELLQHYENMTAEAGYYLAFSGGKDSCVIKELANMAGVKYDAHYNLTTIDPPELVHFIKREHSDVIIDRPEQPFLSRLVYMGYPPTRQTRYCCREYKERGGQGRYTITGIRRAESNNRKNRRNIEICRKDDTKIFVNPIIEWDDQDVWKFIRSNNISYCKLYDEGWKRVGCLFCPFASKRERNMHAERYPKIKQNFIRAFERLYDKKTSEGKEKFFQWKSGEEMFLWWITNQGSRKNEQCTIFE